MTRPFMLSEDFRDDGEPVFAVWNGEGGDCFYFARWEGETAERLVELLNKLIEGEDDDDNVDG